jgi:hypothetical protein
MDMKKLDAALKACDDLAKRLPRNDDQIIKTGPKMPVPTR